MFRSISKLSRIVSLHRRSTIVCHYSQVTPQLDRIPNLFDSTLEYFYKSPRYTIFNPAEPNLFEFDTETRELTQSNILTNAKSISWKDSPVDATNADLILTLKNVCDHCRETNTSLSSEEFDAFVDEISTRMPKFTSNEALCALQIFARVPSIYRPFASRNFAEIMIGLDQATTINAAKWDISQLMYAASVWCTIPMAKNTFYARYVGRHFNKYAKLMTVEQLAEAMFYLNSLKRPIDDIRKFENVFEQNIEKMTMQELSIVCNSFMRFDSTLEKPALRNTFFKKVLEGDLDELIDAMLVNILFVCIQSKSIPSSYIRRNSLTIYSRFQVVRKSARNKDIGTIVALQEKLRKSLDQRTARTCVLVADLGSTLGISDDGITEYVLNRCMTDPNAFETFIPIELERLSRIIGVLNFTSASGIETLVGQALLGELRNRIDRITDRGFHQIFIQAQVNLTLSDIYDLEMLENTLRKDYISFMYFRSKQLAKEMYSLDAYARINLASIYKGDRLEEVNLEKLGRFLSDYFPDDQPKPKTHAQFQVEVAKCLKSLFEHFNFAHAASHFYQPDIFMAVDKRTGKAVDVKHRFPPRYTGQLIPAQSIIGEDQNLAMYAIVCGNYKMFQFRSGRMVGPLKQRLQQLELMGYHTVLVRIGCVCPTPVKLNIYSVLNLFHRFLKQNGLI